jgi:hypothetical protein
MTCFVCQNTMAYYNYYFNFTRRSCYLQPLHGKIKVLVLPVSQPEFIAYPVHRFQAQAYEFVQRNPDLFA